MLELAKSRSASAPHCQNLQRDSGMASDGAFLLLARSTPEVLHQLEARLASLLDLVLIPFLQEHQLPVEMQVGMGE